MSPAVKNGLLLALLVVVLAAAGFLFTRKDKEKAYPATGYETKWICEKCGKHYLVGPAQLHDWETSPDRLRRDPNYPARVRVFMCDDCKEYTVVRADVNRSTGEWFPTMTSKGEAVTPPGSKQPAKKEGTAPKKEAEAPKK